MRLNARVFIPEIGVAGAEAGAAAGEAAGEAASIGSAAGRGGSEAGEASGPVFSPGSNTGIGSAEGGEGPGSVPGKSSGSNSGTPTSDHEGESSSNSSNKPKESKDPELPDLPDGSNSSDSDSSSSQSGSSSAALVGSGTSSSSSVASVHSSAVPNPTSASKPASIPSWAYALIVIGVALACAAIIAVVVVWRSRVNRRKRDAQQEFYGKVKFPGSIEDDIEKETAPEEANKVEEPTFPPLRRSGSHYEPVPLAPPRKAVPVSPIQRSVSPLSTISHAK